jgi:rSAM/selenodomain-associated transferase 1
MQTYPVWRPTDGRKVDGGCALAMMIKAPRAGSSKTRLAPPLTLEQAARMSRCFLTDTAANIAAAVADGGASAIAVYTPIGLEAAFDGLFPESFALVAQHEGGFGERLFRAVEDLLALGFASVCLIDSDSPTLPTASLRAAVDSLAQPGDRMILGPSDDGGYYLIGLKKAHPRVFADIAWSTEQVSEQTLQRAQEIGLPVERLPTWFDVDDASSLARLGEELFGKSGSPGFPAPQTRAFLTELMQAKDGVRLWPAASEI